MLAFAPPEQALKKHIARLDELEKCSECYWSFRVSWTRLQKFWRKLLVLVQLFSSNLPFVVVDEPTFRRFGSHLKRQLA